MQRSNGVYIMAAVHDEGVDTVLYKSFHLLRDRVILLVGHDMSALKRLNPLIKPEECRKWLRMCCETHQEQERTFALSIGGCDNLQCTSTNVSGTA